MTRLIPAPIIITTLFMMIRIPWLMGARTNSF
jgi:hypothetical protein